MVARSQTKIYWIWDQMVRRCTLPRHKDFKNYGARGIGVCRDWLNFEKFVEDMGEPEVGMTLERIDNGAGYSNNNCRWASRKEQANNFRRNVVVTYRGKEQSLSMWADEIGLSAKALHTRYRVGDRGEFLFRPAIVRAKPSMSSYPRRAREQVLA